MSNISNENEQYFCSNDNILSISNCYKIQSPRLGLVFRALCIDWVAYRAVSGTRPKSTLPLPTQARLLFHVHYLHTRLLSLFNWYVQQHRILAPAVQQ